MKNFEGQVEGLELYPTDSGELLKGFEQGWSNLIGAVFRKINQMVDWQESKGGHGINNPSYSHTHLQQLSWFWWWTRPQDIRTAHAMPTPPMKIKIVGNIIKYGRHGFVILSFFKKIHQIGPLLSGFS